MKKTKNRTIANSTLWFVLLIGVGCAGCGNKKKISTVKLTDNQPLPGSTGHSITESTVGESNDLLPSSQGDQAVAPSNQVSEAPTQDADHQPAQSKKSKGNTGKKKQGAKKAPKKDNKKTPPKSNLNPKPNQVPAPKSQVGAGASETSVDKVSVENLKLKRAELEGLVDKVQNIKNRPDFLLDNSSKNRDPVKVNVNQFTNSAIAFLKTINDLALSCPEGDEKKKSIEKLLSVANDRIKHMKFILNECSSLPKS